jgi:hypothetical protein
MQLVGRHRIRLAALLAIAAAALACQDSNMTTAPSSGTASPASTQLAGAWTGSFQVYDSTRCGNSPATATFSQNGTSLTGYITTSDCGVSGAFRGALQGTQIVGWIDMAGCTGGGVSGTFSGSRLNLTIGDLTKPLVTGNKVLLSGGAMSLGRQ